MTRSGLLVVLGFLMLVGACNKKNKDDSTPKSAQRVLLESGKWRLTAYTATLNYSGADSTIDLYATMSECDKDDFLLFGANGKATMDEGANKCAYDAQIETAGWVLLNNDTKLVLADNNPDTMSLEISAMQMKLTQVKPNSSGVPVTYVNIFANIK